MTKPRVTTADRLSNIIEVVELGRRSGLLTVERGAPPSLEQGELYFAQGRAIYAAVEGLTGRDALHVLAGWGQCKFAFEPNAAAPAPNVTAPHPAPASPASPLSQSSPGYPGMSGAQGNGGYAPPQRAQATPPRGAPASFNWNTPGSRPLPDPLAPSTGPVGPLSPGAQPGPQPGVQRGPQAPSQVGGAGASNPAIPSGPAGGAGSWPAGWPSTSQGGGSGGAPASGSRATGQLNWSSQTGALPSVAPSWPSMPSMPSTPSQGTGPFSGGAALDQEALQRRPRRAPDVRDLMSVVSAYNLSRSHRTILLLADGEHTVLDLARLSSKTVEEVAALLASLERLGLVYYF
ncbi:MAG TPA: DUF4388 domain-containing protein [Ktedonobacterales bacterium]|nr:DUF4388 domain-containing protein [Ktedonobacterales bacterium]HEX5571390.1 DUF4388 domain-containing protein [Ktedonobacterales bacterium]